MTDFSHLGTGALKDIPDERDYQVEGVMAAPIVDWNNPFVLPEPSNEDQNGSMSCTAQAWSYYHWQLHQKDYSRRDLYSRIFQPAGGAYIRDGGLALVGAGQATRDELADPSPETEQAMRSGSASQTQEASDKEMASFVLPNGDIDSVAAAIKQYKGVVFGVEGNYNDWQDIANPNPPTSVAWSHALYLFGYHLHGGMKCTIAKSSWGTAGNTTVHHIKENYYLSGHTFNPWTLIPKEKFMTNAELVYKEKDGQKEYGFYIPCTSPEALISYGKNFAIDIPHTDDHTVEWDKLEAHGEIV